MGDERRFIGLTARERYEKEYRECRMFNAYTDSKWDFHGDAARLHAYQSWCMRGKRFSGWKIDAFEDAFHETVSERFRGWWLDTYPMPF